MEVPSGSPQADETPAPSEGNIDSSGHGGQERTIVAGKVRGKKRLVAGTHGTIRMLRVRINSYNYIIM